MKDNFINYGVQFHYDQYHFWWPKKNHTTKIVKKQEIQKEWKEIKTKINMFVFIYLFASACFT